MHKTTPISSALRQAAQSGDPAAMCRLAQAHEDAGHADEAALWFRKAAQAGDPVAKTQMGLWHISGRTGVANAEQGRHLIQDAATGGNLPAQRLLASLYATGTGCAQDWGKALSWTIKAAKAGDSDALTQIAMLLPDMPRLALLRQTLLYAAASAGHDSACHQLGSMLLASGDAAKHKSGLGWIKMASDAGNPAAFATLSAHEGQRMTRAAPVEQVKRVPWMDLRRLVRLPHEQPLPPAQKLKSAPEIRLIHEFLPVPTLDYIIGTGHRHLSPATVNDAEEGEIEDASRSNSYMNFRLIEANIVVHSINDYIMKAMGAGVIYGDPLSLLHYQPGQSYRPHFDFFDPDFPAHQLGLEQSGQRPHTALLYLNDDYEAGETRFHTLDLDVKGIRGDLLIFDNVTADGAPDRRSLHSGESPASGEKWILSKWARTKPAPLY